ncbi:hypothetical protein, conserved [Entamoeba dispar SAW760]|uniref:AIG1-type G domain-containing protein n=1 Tax=Entamoeba dispar (strain ATCC PRA-260 / SAW760) TaxID=370354 RepID=B0EV14_ENTDS|nr:uncharacterized protein EDI_036160 [Entamoeba dispar SAW760]EDR21630.1 hypothetical protein, conserved [Entamoeba dispar SAW760]|eukprot:EDR21630.1 hypothetical protein, conserved [Entamoeba dispar SAW760]
MISQSITQTKLILIGKTGDGKSSLGNYILNKKVFSENDGAKSVTQKTMGDSGEGDRKNVFVIDTPGFQDCDGVKKQEEHTKQMVNYIKKQKGLQAIVICLDINQDRLSNEVKTMIQIISNVFPIYDFWEHVCIVWTKCYNYTPKKIIDKKIENKKNSYLNELSILAKETTGDERVILPMYFVDSQPDEESDNIRSDNEIKSMLTWIRFLPHINVEEIQEPDSKYRKIIMEYKQETEIIEVQHGYIKLKIKHLKRENRIGYDGIASFGAWKEEKSKIKMQEVPEQLADTSKEKLQELKYMVGDRKFENIVDGVLNRNILLGL